MDCKRIRRYLSDYIEGELEKGIHKEVEEHIKRCKRCSQELFELKGLLDIAKKMDRIRASADFEEKLKRRIALDGLSPKRRLLRHIALIDILRAGAWLRPVAIASLIVLALLIRVNILSGRLKDTDKQISRLSREMNVIKSVLEVKDREILAVRQILKNEIYLPQKMEYLYKKALFYKRFREFDEARNLLYEIIVKCPYKDISKKARDELINMPRKSLNNS